MAGYKNNENYLDTNLDLYIRNKVQTLAFQSQAGIELSRDFCERVMQTVTNIERRRSITRVTLYSFFALVPFLTRAIWVVARNDSVSLSRFPLGGQLVSVYGLFMAPWTPYVLLGLGIFFLPHIIKNRSFLASQRHRQAT